MSAVVWGADPRSSEDEGRTRGTNGDAYSDRIRTPAETVKWLRPHFAGLGITRLADQTSLDRIGIPSFAAFRPNSCTLANNQGKGLDRDAAMASAVMEAAEFAIAEQPQVEVATLSLAEIAASGRTAFLPRRQMPMGWEPDPERPMRWVAGRDLVGGDAVLVPFDAVSIDGSPGDLPAISQSTNGLASGNCFEEALFHGLCELVERDAGALWWLRSKEAHEARCFDARLLGDLMVTELARRVADAGLTLRLYDQTSDIEVPTIMAIIGPPASQWAKRPDLAAGYGSHPVAARAAIRAITEAAQTRVTSIAGSRDDIAPGAYANASEAAGSEFLYRRPTGMAPEGMPLGCGLGQLTLNLFDRLAERGVDQIVAVPLGGDGLGISVIKLFAPGLEDREANCNWRPGARALSIVMEEG